MADLFPTHQGLPLPFTMRHEPSNFATADEAIADYGRGTPDHQWTYVDSTGNEVGRTIRWNMPNDKVVRPVALGPNGWTRTGIPYPRPLLHLPKLLADADSTVFVAEGEKLH